jgi:integrase
MSKRGRPRKREGAVYRRRNSGFWQVRYRDQKGEIIRESAGTADPETAERFLRDRLDARDEGRLATVLNSKQLTFNQWADWFLERRSKPPFRSPGNHQQNLNALKFLRPAFGEVALSDITTEAIESYLVERLDTGRRVHTKLGLQLRGKIKPATAHQEFRILSHMLNVAVKQKRLSANPCVAVEFPVSVSKSTRKPHYMTSTEQGKIELAAPGYLKNIVVILSEMGLRYKKELLSMKKSQVDLDNGLVHIADSKTTNGIGDMPMTEPAREAFQRQIDETPGSPYLFPTPKEGTDKPYMTNLRKVWAGTLTRAGVPYFALYELRHTFATRLSAGGVADHMVTQMLRQGDADVFKLYSQAKLGMMREALTKLDRHANERRISSTEKAS